MTDGEASEKIMKAADKYARAREDIVSCEERGTCNDIEEAERHAKTRRWELEQMVKAALFATKKANKEAV